MKTRKTKAERREAIRESIRDFGKTMSGAPEPVSAPRPVAIIELDAETRRIWEMIENA